MTQTLGQLARLACAWEVLARKAGNVCPGRDFPDLTVNDFLRSADAIAPVLEQAPTQALGVTILRCIAETRKVVQTNTNLGIVLLLAPLASVPLDQPLRPGLADVLSRTTVEDSRNAYAAIRLARPGGLGNAPDQDVRDEPTLPLRDVMALAMDRDMIAAQYVTDFADVIRMAEAITHIAGQHHCVERAIIETQLSMLARHGDDLIRRKLGEDIGIDRVGVLQLLGAIDTPAGKQAFRDFDARLRSDNHARNPGTTADLIAAALFVSLRESWLSLDAPFDWPAHPFQSSA